VSSTGWNAGSTTDPIPAFSGIPAFSATESVSVRDQAHRREPAKAAEKRPARPPDRVAPFGGRTVRPPEWLRGDASMDASRDACAQEHRSALTAASRLHVARPATYICAFAPHSPSGEACAPQTNPRIDPPMM
jgi:hypothetical protein